MPTNKQVLLVSRPDRAHSPEAANFAVHEAEIPAPGPGQVLLQTLYLSLDPYMRARMYEGANYTAGAVLGQPMVGGTVSRIIRSNHPGYSDGQIVESGHGWQQYALSDGTGLRVIDPALAPVSTALGVLGMPGHTAYTALMAHGRPTPGETVLVSAASGAVGSVVGQTARLKGARAVGIAGGPDKCAYLTTELGLDAAVDHRAPDFAARLAAACPGGVDVYYDNVGGPVTAAVLPLLNPYARLLVCGTVSVDRDRPGSERPAGTMQELLSAALVKRLTIRGFIFSDPDLVALEDEFRATVGGWIRAGKLKYREDIVEGIEAAPEAFLGLFRGANFGKLLVRVHPE
ncbi:MAG: NADP-dependent oxidoreductase [Rhodobacteraceae bacterium]|nr:NADP-dependent oxidoreductase [Paracoccaceae bacterium]